MWSGSIRARVVVVAYPREFDGGDPAAWALAHPDSCYPFLWPEAAVPQLGTWARTPDDDTPVVVVGYGHPGTFRNLKTLIARADWSPA